jgi:hypothetical protein
MKALVTVGKRASIEVRMHLIMNVLRFLIHDSLMRFRSYWSLLVDCEKRIQGVALRHANRTKAPTHRFQAGSFDPAARLASSANKKRNTVELAITNCLVVKPTPMESRSVLVWPVFANGNI